MIVTVQLGDFGLVTKQLLSTNIDDTSDRQEHDSDSGQRSTTAGLRSGGGDVRGTLSYAAPELLLGVRPTTAVDMWATGCLLAEMVTGRILFQASSVIQQVRLTRAWIETVVRKTLNFGLPALPLRLTAHKYC